MKNKTIIIIIACLLTAAFALGASGAASLADPDRGEDKAAQGGDRLIGALVTRAPLDLFDFEGYFNDNASALLAGGEISEADAAPYEGRLYAKLVEADKQYESGEKSMEYVFEGVEGIRFFAPTMQNKDGEYFAAFSDDAMADVNTAVNVTDYGDSVSLEGTIYYSANAPENSFYVNPVYQTPEGSVYAVSGSGSSFGGDSSAGASYSMEIKEETNATAGGKTTENSRSSVRVNVKLVEPPTRIAVAQFDEDGGLLSREEYAPGKLPETLSAEAKAAYIVVETLSADGTMRELYQKSDETLASFVCGSNGICEKHATNIEWSK